MPGFAVILPAAGTASRFGRNKLLEPLGGIPILLHTVGAFMQRQDVLSVVIAAKLAQDGQFQGPVEVRAALRQERVRMVEGGPSRAESVRRALEAVPEDVQWVAVHDAARPLVSPKLIDATLAAALVHGAAAPALPVALTIKRAVGPLPARAAETIPRGTLWAMQTPQIFRRAWLEEAFESCPMPLDAITDDAQLLELAGREVWLVPGEERNLKVTTPQDLHLAHYHLREIGR